ncbi:hypothetical protein Tco_0616157 [Tanacetum coccineum]
MSFSKRPDSDAVCYTKPLDSLKRWNDHFFWVSFACPASFPWHTDKNVSRDPFPKSTEFSADDYAVLVGHPAPFRKFSEPFLCLIGMSRNYTLDEDTYPTFLHDDRTGGCLPTCIVQLERAEGEAKLLDSTVGRVVPLLPVDPARAESELEESVERLFDEGGSADPGDSAARGGHDADIESTMGVRIIATENVTAERPKRPRKKRQAATDAGGSSHPLKKLRGDYGTSSAAATSVKSPSVLKELLASSMLNVEAGVAAAVTLPMVTSSVSATPEHESGTPTDSITRLNLRTLGPTERFIISSDSSYHSSTNATEAGIDSFVRSVTPHSVMTEAVITTNVTIIPSAPAPEAGTKWNVSNDTFLDDHDVSQEFIDHLAPPVLFSQIREMDYHHLFTEFNVGTARQACLNAEVRMRTEYCLSERRRLEFECEKQAKLLKVRDAEIKSLKAQLLLKETKAAEAVHLRAQVSATEATEKMHASEIDALKQKNVALENEKESLNGKVAEFQSSVSTKDPELKELNAVVSSLRSQKDGLVGQVHELEATCSVLRGQVSSYERLKELIEDVSLKIL